MFYPVLMMEMPGRLLLIAISKNIFKGGFDGIYLSWQLRSPGS